MLCIAALVVIVGGAVAIWQRNNLKAAQLYMSSSPEEIESKISDNEERITESIKEMLPVPIKDLTQEEKEMLASAELTKEEAVELILGRANAAANTEGRGKTGGPEVAESEVVEGEAAESGSAGGESASAANEGRAGENTEERSAEGGGNLELAGIAAEVYVLRAQFTSKIESLKQRAASEYGALSPEERTASKKTELGMKYIQMAGQLEAECDGQMNSIIARVKAEVQAGNVDASFVSELQNAYAEEKSLQKAYYLSLYNNK